MEQYYITYKGKKLLGPMSRQEAEEKQKYLSLLFINLEITPYR
ncbi:hypothetical protein ACVLD2_004075 [Paenibacillus sp. PvR052]|nr:hypothetical protein [Paenibacillus sp. PvP091]MBP1170627.1 hypothetical protein [Paenibacillus sp. PvR098]MBP2441655.1 hypothetical protein [Paenibacillus sp. PvP052]